MPPFRVVFMGTPDFAVPSLAALMAGPDHVVGVLTQPDRPSGRGMRLQPSPVKQYALGQGLSVYQPETLRHPDSLSLLQRLEPDLVVVTAYGLILPPAILSVPRQGCINVHASLLPRWRGAAPLQRAILAGDRETGVTIMMMEAGLDTGPILAMESTPLDDTMTYGRLHDQLAQQGADLLATTLMALKGQTIRPYSQPEDGVTMAQKLTREEEWIDWTQGASIIHRQIRALNPWPGARSLFQGQPVKMMAGRDISEKSLGQPGEIVAISDLGCEVACGHGRVLITQVTPGGKKTMSAKDWINGRRITVGQQFGS
ncbi:MAG: methionyl-tRNA formyltransferase [Magnetococcus sp. THC-1_WYH]